MGVHCCFSTDEKKVPTPRIHVPLAGKCSMGCVYCGYRFDGNITSSVLRPGVAGRVVSSYEDIEAYLSSALDKLPSAEIIGVSGPGDPLENFNELNHLVEIMRDKWPSKKLCLCTNGRFFFPYGQIVADSGILKYITFTINTLDKENLPKIYNCFSADGCAGESYIEGLISAISYCKQKGIAVKVNTVLIKGINDAQIESMFERLRHMGVDCFNLLPHRNVRTEQTDSSTEYWLLRQELQRKGFLLTRHCMMCRSDYCGE